jgi:hypothetical protein
MGRPTLNEASGAAASRANTLYHTGCIQGRARANGRLTCRFRMRWQAPPRIPSGATGSTVTDNG